MVIPVHVLLGAHGGGGGRKIEDGEEEGEDKLRRMKKN